MSGNGKARRILRSVVEAMAINSVRGVGPQQFNHYIIATKAFTRWLLRIRRITSDPLETMARVNASVDIRRQRRELTADELQRLFVVARSNERTFRGLSVMDRYYL